MVVQHAIVPRISISQAINNWQNIKAGLMEKTRNRKLQAEILNDDF
jgi:hypothetical protein